MTGKHPVLLFLMGFVLAFFFSIRIFNDGVPGWKHIVTSDGRGYYAYLPALLLDHDPSFASVVEREKKLLGYEHYRPGYIVKTRGQTINKYFSGEAVLLFPFFILGILFTFLFGTSMDGYSFFFQFFTGLGALFYLVLGLNFLRHILDAMQIRPRVIALVLVAILLGTNLFYYSLWQPTMSHVFSFFAINGFLWFTLRALREWNIKTAMWTGFFLGMTCLIRPTNIVVILLVPFLAEDKVRMTEFISRLRINKVAVLLFLLTGILVLSIQVLLWYIQTGRPFIWSYQSEGFRFGSPEIMNVLFSYRKGLFIYTPLILVSWCGLIPLFLRSRFQFFSISVFLLSSTYIIASWWNWYYGDGFGLRAFIDYYGIFAILLAMLLKSVPGKAGSAVMILALIPFLSGNFMQTWQYTNRVIQPNSMNGEKFKYIYMRMDSSVINCLGGNQELAGYTIDAEHPVRVYFNDFEKDKENWNPSFVVRSFHAFSSEKAGYLDSVHPFSPGLAIRAGQLGRIPSSYYVEGELMIFDSINGASNGALVVLSLDSIHPGENYWQGFKLNDVPHENTKTWRKCTFSLMLPEISNPKGILKIYVWNTRKKPMLIDDFRVRFYGERKEAGKLVSW